MEILPFSPYDIPVMNQKHPIQFETVFIVGVGLIGGSIAKSLKSRQFDGKIIGFGRNEERLEKCRSTGLIDEFSTDVIALEKPDSLIIFCTPIDHIVKFFQTSQVSFCKTSLITDAGSTKLTICETAKKYLPQDVPFIGSHPIAGSEKQGFEHAMDDLFVDRVCVLTPLNDTKETAITCLKEFWEFLGSRVEILSPKEHDFHLAQTSHLPHLIASALAGVLSEESSPFASTGFLDTTRISSGDSSVWVPILLDNSEAVLENISRYESVLGEYRKALENRDAQSLKKLLDQAKNKRKQVNSD